MGKAIHLKTRIERRLYKSIPAAAYLSVVVPEESWRQLGDKLPIRVVLRYREHQAYRAIVSDGQGGAEISYSKELERKWGLEREKEYDFTLELDTSEYGMPVPEEVAALLEFDEHLKAKWDELLPGKKRNYLHWIGSAKTEPTRLKRVAELAQRLEAGTAHLVGRSKQ